jgi:hypothetical protein
MNAMKGQRTSRQPRKPAQASDDGNTIAIDELLASAGFDTAASRKQARAVLEAAGLTRPGKRGIASYKDEGARAALASALVRVCGKTCASLVQDGRTPVIVAGTTCEVCRGSNNRKAGMAARKAMAAAGATRLLVVGGTLQGQYELEAVLAGDGVTVAFVDGSRGSHTQKQAIANMRRADVAVIWGATPLRHAVSELYTRDPLPHLRVILVRTSGVEAVCRELQRSFGSS